MVIEFILFPILLGGVVLYRSQKGWTDQKKIEKVLELLEIKEGNQTRKFTLLRKTDIENGVEYVYKIPLKSSMDKIESIYPAIRDGINIKREGNQKHVEIEYDGALKITVYEKDIPKKVDFTKETLEQCKGWTICLGETYKGTILHDFEKAAHMLVAGITRYGKTVLLKNIITTLTANHPEHAIFSLIDLKGGLAFNRFKNLRQVKYTAYDVEETLDILRKLEIEMENKFIKMREGGFEDIGESGEKERHFIIIDEGADLSSSMVKGKEKQLYMECEKILSKIYRKGAGVGIRCIYATQYPLQKNLPDSVKINSDAKVVFRLTNETASRTVLDSKGAEKLPIKKDDYQGGRAIYLTDKELIVQTPFISNKLIDELLAVYQVVKDVEVNNGDRQGENRTNTIEFR